LKVETKSEDLQPAKSSCLGANSCVTNNLEDSEWDEFGSDPYAFPVVPPVQSSNAIQDATSLRKADDNKKIRALIDTPTLDWQRQKSDGFGTGRGIEKAVGGIGFGRGGLEWKTPPQGYICHRCKVPGHFIQHCPTNGDPNYDIKRVRPPTGIPKSMLMETPHGSYALPSGAVAVLKPNETAFDKEMEGLSSTRSVGDDLPPELHCPLCKEVMKYAMLATNILTDDLLPNKTLRDTIKRFLESNNNNRQNVDISFLVQDAGSRFSQPKVPSPTLSAVSTDIQQSKRRMEPMSQRCAPLAFEDMQQQQQKPVFGERDGEMQWIYLTYGAA
ncbi:unnamed protein product, partial [Ilex paraguariensis]